MAKDALFNKLDILVQKSFVKKNRFLPLALSRPSTIFSVPLSNSFAIYLCKIQPVSTCFNLLVAFYIT